jgi:hypothetical protein
MRASLAVLDLVWTALEAGAVLLDLEWNLAARLAQGALVPEVAALESLERVSSVLMARRIEFGMVVTSARLRVVGQRF